jgi:hypothetical protein
MNFPRFSFRLSTASALWVFLALAPLTCAASTNLGPAPAGTNAAAGSKTNGVAGTNAAPTELTVPVSTFELTIKPTKDPFFPLSTRSPVPLIVLTNVAPALSAASFNLKGMSGSSDRRLALINNRTVAVGETAEVTTTSGKVKIHCVEIKQQSVVLRVDSQPDPIEVFFRKEAR